MRALVLLSLLITQISIAQNLIKNPSFENYFECPNKHLGFYETVKVLVPGWYNPTWASPDYYNKCSRWQSGVPKNYVGMSESKEGDAYVGMVLAGNNIPSQKNYREYIQTELINPLKKDSLYCVKFYVKQATYARYATKNVGLYFSKKRLKQWSQEVLRKEPQIEYKGDYIDDSKWYLVCGPYEAVGNEKYVIIGNFGDWENTLIMENPNVNVKTAKTTYAYYYLDEVSITPISTTEPCSCEEGQPLFVQDTLQPVIKSFTPGAVITLPDITFTVKKWELMEKVKPLLDSLSAYLTQHPENNLTISGHTDSTGTKANNQILSENRARSVQEYLSSKGVKPERITVKGYGSSHPIAENETEAGKAKNRRVEIVIQE